MDFMKEINHRKFRISSIRVISDDEVIVIFGGRHLVEIKGTMAKYFIELNEYAKSNVWTYNKYCALFDGNEIRIYITKTGRNECYKELFTIIRG